MIHAENGDMIGWLTSKSDRVRRGRMKANWVTEKLEEKGMNGISVDTPIYFTVADLL